MQTVGYAGSQFSAGGAGVSVGTTGIGVSVGGSGTGVSVNTIATVAVASGLGVSIGPVVGSGAIVAVGGWIVGMAVFVGGNGVGVAGLGVLVGGWGLLVIVGRNVRDGITVAVSVGTAVGAVVCVGDNDGNAVSVGTAVLVGGGVSGTSTSPQAARQLIPITSAIRNRIMGMSPLYKKIITGTELKRIPGKIAPSPMI